MNQPHPLQLVSYLAPNMFGFYQAVATHLSRVLARETQLVQSEHDPLEDPMLLQDQWDLAFICGLPFARRHQLVPGQLQALVAPVMQASRYQNCPVYFADLIVNADSRLMCLEDLKGKTFCYNDPGSNSGYNLLRQRLLAGGYPKDFFGKVIQSGLHQRSIQWVVEGLADCAAIDSTVLEAELRHSPQLQDRLRVVEAIGPFPMPPVVVARHLDAELIDTLASALLQPEVQLQLAMHQVGIQHYVAVQSEDYLPLSRMYDMAVQTGYELNSSRD